jgi:hypothetical protein
LYQLKFKRLVCKKVEAHPYHKPHPYIITHMLPSHFAPHAPAAHNRPDALPTTPVLAGTHWLWWLFLLGVLASASVGPTCAYH